MGKFEHRIRKRNLKRAQFYEKGICVLVTPRRSGIKSLHSDQVRGLILSYANILEGCREF